MIDNEVEMPVVSEKKTETVVIPPRLSYDDIMDPSFSKDIFGDGRTHLGMKDPDYLKGVSELVQEYVDFWRFDILKRSKQPKTENEEEFNKQLFKDIQRHKKVSELLFRIERKRGRENRTELYKQINENLVNDRYRLPEGGESND